MSDFVRRQIKPMKTVGEILREARKKKNVSLSEAEEETKVRAKYLEALERGLYSKLPETVYAAGFLAKYADFLELAKDPLIDQFKRERGLNRTLSRLMPERRIREEKFSITPKFLVIAGIVLFLLLVGGYIFYNVRQFTMPPNLEISSPSTEEVIAVEKVEIIGKTDEGVTLIINDQSVYTDPKGNFSQEVKLSPGLNTFEIRATNQLKKETIKVLKILAEF